MDLGGILGRFWMDLGTPRGPNGHENRYMSREIQVLPSGSPKGAFGDGSGRVWEGSGEVLGGFWKDFKWNPSESLRILANPRES